MRGNLARPAHDPYQRDRNEGGTLQLPLFERAPQHRAALHALEPDPTAATAELPGLLEHRQRIAIPEHQHFRAALAAILGVAEARRAARQMPVLAVANDLASSPAAAPAGTPGPGAELQPSVRTAVRATR